MRLTLRILWIPQYTCVLHNDWRNGASVQQLACKIVIMIDRLFHSGTLTPKSYTFLEWRVAGSKLCKQFADHFVQTECRQHSFLWLCLHSTYLCITSMIVVMLLPLFSALRHISSNIQCCIVIADVFLAIKNCCKFEQNPHYEPKWSHLVEIASFIRFDFENDSGIEIFLLSFPSPALLTTKVTLRFSVHSYSYEWLLQFYSNVQCETSFLSSGCWFFRFSVVVPRESTNLCRIDLRVFFCQQQITEWGMIEMFLFLINMRSNSTDGCTSLMSKCCDSLFFRCLCFSSSELFPSQA